MNYELILFAGTYEGRIIAAELAGRGIRQYICTASGDGKTALGDIKNAYISSKPLSEEEIARIINENGIPLAVDATHPYAENISLNARRAADKCGIRYIRVERESLIGEAGCGHRIFKSLDEAIGFFNTCGGNILSTLGSHAIGALMGINGFSQRVFARMLDNAAARKAVSDSGFPAQNALFKDPPFSVEDNISAIRACKARWVITKDSGIAGGFAQKCEACEKTGAELIIISRPAEDRGIRAENAVPVILGTLNIILGTQKLTVAGIGLGDEGSMTAAAVKAVSNADLICGAARMTEAVRRFNPSAETLCAYTPEDIAAYIADKPHIKSIAAVMSGDVGFYSGAARFAHMGDTAFIPGISTLSALCARVGEEYGDAETISLHGRNAYFVNAVNTHKKVFLLLDKLNTPQKVAETLVEYGLGGVTMHIGADLGSENERVVTGSAREIAAADGFSPLSAALAVNPSPCCAAAGIADAEFEREEKIPMTKSAVRAVIMAKLAPCPDDVCVDIGSGTGSVSVELAGFAREVAAVDIKPEACALTRKNALKFKRQNIRPICADGLEALGDIKYFDKLFIGGSGKKCADIMRRAFELNPRAVAVLTAVTLETLSAATECIKELDLASEIVCINAAEGDTVGSSTLMRAENPVYIIKVTLK